MDGRDAAAVIAQDIQLETARLESAVQRYRELRSAQIILDRVIEEYRSKNQDPLLSRAAEIFKRITLSSYEGVEVEMGDDGRPVLRGVKPGSVMVAVDGMSTGARDQLYLALRLAAIELHLSANTPLPLICDDILVEFDDDRAIATLEVLSELAHKTQIIFLTHHSRMLELSRKALTDAGVAMIELSAPAETSSEPQAA